MKTNERETKKGVGYKTPVIEIAIIEVEQNILQGSANTTLENLDLEGEYW